MRPHVRLRNGTKLLSAGSVEVVRCGRLQRVKVRDLQVGDWVALEYGAGFASESVPLRLPDFDPDYGSQKKVVMPVACDTDLALLLGMYAAEGHTTASNYTIVITNSEDEVLERCAALWRTCFGLHAKIVRPCNRCPAVIVHSKTVVRLLQSLECGRRASTKRIPRELLDSPRDVVLAFLQGLALDAYTSTTGPNAKWALCVDSPGLLDDLQVLLRQLGIVSGRIGKYNPHYDKTYDEVFVCGSQAQRLASLALPRADQTAFRPCDDEARGRRAAQRRRRRATCARLGPLQRDPEGSWRPRWRRQRLGGAVAVALRQANCLALARARSASGGSRYRLPADVQRVLDEDLHFSPVMAAVDDQTVGDRWNLLVMQAEAQPATPG